MDEQRRATQSAMTRLDRPPGQNLPDFVKIRGISYEIDPDFRTVLKIVRMLGDPDVLRAAKPALLAAWFFPKSAPDDLRDALDAFTAFVRPPFADDPAPDGGRDFSFEYDAEEIYASFLSAYGVDLLTLPGLHWYPFRALLAGLPEDSALSRKLRLRRLDESAVTGPDRQRILDARRRVQLPADVDRGADAVAFQSIWDAAGV